MILVFFKFNLAEILGKPNSPIQIKEEPTAMKLPNATGGPNEMPERKLGSPLDQKKN